MAAGAAAGVRSHATAHAAAARITVRLKPDTTYLPATHCVPPRRVPPYVVSGFKRTQVPAYVVSGFSRTHSITRIAGHRSDRAAPRGARDKSRRRCRWRP